MGDWESRLRGLGSVRGVLRKQIGLYSLAREAGVTPIRSLLRDCSPTSMIGLTRAEVNEVLPATYGAKIMGHRHYPIKIKWPAGMIPYWDITRGFVWVGGGLVEAFLDDEGMIPYDFVTTEQAIHLQCRRLWPNRYHAIAERYGNKVLMPLMRIAHDPRDVISFWDELDGAADGVLVRNLGDYHFGVREDWLFEPSEVEEVVVVAWERHPSGSVSLRCELASGEMAQIYSGVPSDPPDIGSTGRAVIRKKGNVWLG